MITHPRCSVYKDAGVKVVEAKYLILDSVMGDGKERIVVVEKKAS